MNYVSVVRLLAMLGLLLAGMMMLPLLVAIATGEAPQVFSLAATLTVLAVLSSMILLLTPKPARRARATDGLGVAILWWILAPIAAAPPFVLGAAETSILPAIHEAASCLTTTGHSVIEIGSGGWPQSLIVLRGVLHLVGAWMTMTVAATVFAAINLGGPGIHRTELFSIPSGSFFEAVPRVGVAAAWVLVLTVLLVFTALVLTGRPTQSAFFTTISLATTGLVDPTNSAPAAGLLAQVIMLIALVSATVGLSILLDVRKGRFLSALSDPEWLTFGLVVATLVVFCGLAGLAAWPALLWSVSALSTSGLPILGPNAGLGLPLSLIVLPALIGGSGLSAAGGIKLGRLFVLGKRAGQEFSQLSYPQSVTSFTFRGREQSESTVIGVWVYLIGYIFALFAAIAVLSFSGAPLNTAILAGVGGLSNAGALTGAATAAPTVVDHFVITICMVLGRLEVLAILPALNPSFWRG